MCACRSEVITDGRVTVLYCPVCGSYMQPPETRVKAELESTQLLTFCLEQLNLDEAGITVVEAKFVWTEPHSRRIKVRLIVQKEAGQGQVLKRVRTVEYVVQHQMCDNCLDAVQ